MRSFSRRVRRLVERLVGNGLPGALAPGLAAVLATVVVTSAQGSSGARTFSASDLVGSWVGEAPGMGSSVTLQVTFTLRPEVLVADVCWIEQDLVLPTTVEVDLEEAQVRFVLATTERGRFEFEGVVDEHILRGRVQGSTRQGPFFLHRFRRLEPSAVTDLCGFYRMPDGHHRIVIPRAHGGLYFVELEGSSLQAGSRMPRDDDRFFRWNARGQIDQEVTFERDARGKVIASRWADRGGAPAVYPRVEDPVYNQHLVRYRNGDVELAGLLLIPTARGPHPAAVWVHGSGPDCTRHHFYSLFLADRLARRGLAVLVPDKRGSGESGGDWRLSSLTDLAGDTLAAVRRLREAPGIREDAIGVMGLSQGGRVVPLVAADPTTAFAVSLSGGVLPWQESIDHEMRNMGLRARLDETEMEELMSLQSLAGSYCELDDEASWKRYRHALDEAREGSWSGRGVAEGYPATPDHWKWNFFRRTSSPEALASWSRVRCPVLAVYGMKDTQVPVAKVLPALRETLRSAGHPDFTIQVYDESGHALEDPKTGWVRRDFLELLAHWIHERADAGQ